MHNDYSPEDMAALEPTKEAQIIAVAASFHTPHPALSDYETEIVLEAAEVAEADEDGRAASFSAYAGSAAYVNVFGCSDGRHELESCIRVTPEISADARMLHALADELTEAAPAYERLECEVAH